MAERIVLSKPDLRKLKEGVRKAVQPSNCPDPELLEVGEPCYPWYDKESWYGGSADIRTEVVLNNQTLPYTDRVLFHTSTKCPAVASESGELNSACTNCRALRLSKIYSLDVVNKPGY